MKETTGYEGGGIIPPNEEWEFRGNQFFHPKTGSSLAIPISYCKDIQGCGEKDYRNVSSVTTINYLDDCVPRLNAVLSVSGLFFNGATIEQQDTLWEMVQLGAEALPAGNLNMTFGNRASVGC